MSAWKAAGISYLQYANIAARALRNVLKDDVRNAALQRNHSGLKYAKWESGVQGEQKFVVKPSAQQ